MQVKILNCEHNVPAKVVTLDVEFVPGTEAEFAAAQWLNGHVQLVSSRVPGASNFLRLSVTLAPADEHGDVT